MLSEIFSIKKLLQVNFLQELLAAKAVKGELHHLTDKEKKSLRYV